MEFKLGNRVRDIVTGFTGIATSKVEYINGCTQYGIKPPVDKDGKMPDTNYIDHAQLEFVDDGIVINQNDTGGDMPDAPKH